MKFCRNCGTQIDDNAIFCPNCGSRTNGDNPRNTYSFNPYDRGGFYGYDMRESLLVAILSFCLWQVGIVLWFFWRGTRPGKARSAMKGTLAGACFQFPIMGLVLWCLWRGDSDKQDIAKIVSRSAIIGASLALALSIIITALASMGYVQLPNFSSDYFYGQNALFLLFNRR